MMESPTRGLSAQATAIMTKGANRPRSVACRGTPTAPARVTTTDSSNSVSYEATRRPNTRIEDMINTQEHRTYKNFQQ